MEKIEIKDVEENNEFKYFHLKKPFSITLLESEVLIFKKKQEVIKSVLSTGFFYDYKRLDNIMNNISLYVYENYKDIVGDSDKDIYDIFNDGADILEYLESECRLNAVLDVVDKKIKTKIYRNNKRVSYKEIVYNDKYRIDLVVKKIIFENKTQKYYPEFLIKNIYFS